METVAGENLSAATDRDLLSACKRERRCLVTLDLDFANPLLFPPDEYFGIAVIWVRTRMNFKVLRKSLQTLLRAVRKTPVMGRLWIVEDDKIREYMPDAQGQSHKHKKSGLVSKR